MSKVHILQVKIHAQLTNDYGEGVLWIQKIR